MAMACKCDRCGKLFEPGKDHKIKRLHITSPDIYDPIRSSELLKKMDLCDTCYDDLEVFLKKTYESFPRMLDDMLKF